jgi:hypothetical protein
LEPFLDALIPLQLQNQNIAGAVVSVVKDGQLLLETFSPLSPERFFRSQLAKGHVHDVRGDERLIASGARISDSAFRSERVERSKRMRFNPPF